MLADDRTASADSAAPSAGGDAATDVEGASLARAYPEAALPERQARVTDLIPMRRWVILLLFLTGAGAIGGLLWLHEMAKQWSDVIGRQATAGLEFSSPGGLAGWFSSMLLTMAAIGAVLIYSVRRHRVDDYRGRYRVWLWAAALWLFAGIDVIAGIHLLVRGVMVHLTGNMLYDDGTIWWVLLYGAIYGVLAIAVLFDVRHSRGAAVTLTAAIACYVFAAAGRFDVITAELNVPISAVTATMLMSGHLLLLLTTGVYARYVHLDAQGLLPARVQKQAKPKKVESENEATRGRKSSGKQTKIDSAHPVKRIGSDRTDLDSAGVSSSGRSKHANDRTGTIKKASKSDDATDSSEAPSNSTTDDGQRHLSKAERRRLRKQKRRQRQDQ